MPEQTLSNAVAAKCVIDEAAQPLPNTSRCISVTSHPARGAKLSVPDTNKTACVVHATERDRHMELCFHGDHSVGFTPLGIWTNVPTLGTPEAAREIPWYTRDAECRTTTHNSGAVLPADMPVDAFWAVVDVAACTISIGTMLSDTERGPKLFDMHHPTVAQCTHYYAGFYDANPDARMRTSLVPV